MIKVKAIAPLRLEEDEVARRQRRYDHLAAGEMEITLVNLEGEGAPLRFDSPEEIESSERLTYEEMLRTDPGEFDVILPDCVLDPGIDRRPASAVPAVGILALAVGHLHSLGVSFAAVTRNAVIGAELERKVKAYGLGDSLTGVEVLDIDFCFVSDHEGWSKAMAPLARSLADRGVGVLLNGCSAVDMASRSVEGVLVVDPTELALRMLGAASRVELHRVLFSRRGH